jgi:transposase, IS30 family
MRYRQVTDKERYFISGALAKGHSKTFIARFLGRHRSTIHREIERNKDSKGHYKYWIAQGSAKYRRSASRRNSYFPETVWAFVKANIKTEWAPEQVVGKLTLVGGPRMHWVTIYREIKRDKRKGGRLFKHLRQASKKRRKGYGRPDSRGVLRGKRNISERPQAANDRSELGHCEADLVRGYRGLGWALTLIDRSARLVRIRKLRGKSVQEVNRKLIPILRELGVKTLTVDGSVKFLSQNRIGSFNMVLHYAA